ncbi:MAG: hypothetical protein GC201_00975 [Alphaproteobacteria bacterium]|nr:hypothetical protein [Alphaproteobacteria bacterium]
MRTFDPGQFNFDDQDIRIALQSTSSGTSLSGIEEPIVTDGGGRLIAEFKNGTLLSREQNLLWRAMTAAMDGGATPVIVMFCDARHQPLGSPSYVPHSDDTPFDDDSLYSGGGYSDIESAQNKALRSTTMRIKINSTEKDIIGGEWFGIEHATWGWRAYNVISITKFSGIQYDIEFRPPLREAIVSGDVLDFNRPRCQMRVAQATSNPLSMGRTGGADIAFVEDMKKPAEV